MPVSLQIQSVLYNNEKESLGKALESLANAVRINRSSTKELSDVTVSYGDASPERVYDDEEIALISKKFKNYFDFKYTFFNENTGSAKGHNLLGKDCKCDYMQILNPDIIVTPRFFSVMLEPFLRDGSDAGITEARQTPVEHPKEYNKETFETGWATTACVIFPTKLFKEIDGFDSDSFFMYCDDLDFSWRVRLSGKKIYYCPDAAVFHAKRLSVNASWEPTKAERYYSAEAAIIMAYKWSNKKRAEMLCDNFLKSNEENQVKAAKHYLSLKESDCLPKQLDADHKIAEFVGDYYSKHRFVL